MKKVGKYRLETTIGKGAYGEVFKGCDLGTGEVVAIKAVALKSLNRQLQKQLEVELNVLKTLNSPYVIRLMDVIKTTNNVYMVTELCTGGDLERYLAVHKRVEESLARRWLWNLLEALAALHANGVIHRDIKPANILLSHEDENVAVAKLADFGFARFTEEQMLVRTVLGTPMFMAPEVLADKAYTYKVDVWGLGVLAYEMLVGTEAFQARTVAELKAAQARGILFPPNCALSDDTKSFLKSVLVYDANQRLDFTSLKLHPFFQSSALLINPDDYEVLENWDPDESTAIINDFSFVEDSPGLVEMETIEDEAETRANQDKKTEEMMFIDYQVDVVVSSRVELAAKYDNSQKPLLSFAILLNSLNELEKLRAKLTALSSSCTVLTHKIAGKIDELHGLLDLIQAKLTSEDLARSVMQYEDTGLQVDSRLLVTEASRLLQAVKRTSAVEEKQRLVKDCMLFLTMACGYNPEDDAAGRMVVEAAREYRSLMGASFRY